MSRSQLTPRPPPDDAQANIKVLSLVPERRLLHSELLSSMGAQFWNQGTQSTLSLDGLACTAPGEPTPLPLNTPSGISRTQFLIAAQAMTLPGFPSHNSSDGGIVADRVLLHTGSDSWWATLTGRAKVQRILRNRKESGLQHTLTDASNYTLCANTRATLGPKTHFRARAEVSHGGHGQRSQQSKEELINTSSKRAWWQGGRARCHAQFKHKLRGAEIKAEVGLDQRLSSASSTYTTAPFTASLDIATPPGQTSNVQYRAGLFHVGGLLTTWHSVKPWSTLFHVRCSSLLSAFLILSV